MRAPGTRIVTVDPPQETGSHHGLAYTLFLPATPPIGAVLVLHGADSAKESHHDFARACRATGFAALCFDQRGHGASEGAMDGNAIDDVVVMARLLRDRAGPGAPLAMRGSSMGGYFALVAATPAGAAAVVAICPAAGTMLARGVVKGRFAFAVDAAALSALLNEHDEITAASAFEGKLLLLHAEGDLQVPVEHSRELHAAAPGSRLIAVPGGHHRSIQHDVELQGEVLRWLRRALRPA